MNVLLEIISIYFVTQVTNYKALLESISILCMDHMKMFLKTFHMLDILNMVRG